MIIVFNTTVEDRNFYYLSGIEEYCHGVVLYDGKPKVLATSLNAEVAGRYAETQVFGGRKEFWEMLKEEAGTRVSVNFSRLSVKTLEALKKHGFEVRDASRSLGRKRAIKSPQEVAKMSKACKIASQVLEEARDTIVPGMTELDLKAELEYLALKKGADGFAFRTVVASGPRSAVPHAVASQRKLRRGDAVVVDFGPTYKLYASDISRTFVLGGNRAFEERYLQVLGAQTRALRAAKEGARVKELNGLVEAATGKLVHLVGHGVGLDIHENPLFVRGALRNGMVVAIEPGVYKGFGVRIEDMVHVGGRKLTSAPKDLDFARV